MARNLTTAVLVLAAIAVAAYSLTRPSTTIDRKELGGLLKGPLATMTVIADPKLVTDHIVALEDGTPIKLSDMKGKAMLVNLWASYCVPCRVEMPELSHLQAEVGSENFEVVAINVDRGGHKMAAEIMEEWGVEGLAVYADPTAKIAFDLAEGALPMSLVVDREGLVRAYYLGALKWDAPESIAFFEALRDGKV